MFQLKAGQVPQTKEYDWGNAGSGVSGSLIRETDNTYTTAAPFQLTQILIKDGSGTTKYREDRVYDGTSVASQTGAANHDDINYGTSYTTRGNLTLLTTYADPATPSGGQTKAFTYDMLGNALTAQVSCCQQKQFNYSSSNQYSAPISVVSGSSGGSQLTTSVTYNAYTGLVATTTDENLQVTTYTYDVYKRLTTVQRPDTTQLSTSYDDTNFIVTSTTPIDSSNSNKSVIAYDGLGRAITSKLEDGNCPRFS